MNILLLAGTGEARTLAPALRDAGHQMIASLAGATRNPLATGVETRVGGFGGDDGFLRWLDDHPTDLVLDATHPFADQISQRSAKICAKKNIPYLQLLRPEWQAGAGDRWTLIDRAQTARDHIAPGQTAFLATGRQTLDEFANLGDCTLYCRQIDPPDGPFPFANGSFVVGRPPFSEEDEVALFTKLKVDWLVVKNAGGAASRSKLDAARQIGLPVLMINRPAQPAGDKVASVVQALAWVKNYADN